MSSSSRLGEKERTHSTQMLEKILLTSSSSKDVKHTQRSYQTAAGQQSTKGGCPNYRKMWTPFNEPECYKKIDRLSSNNQDTVGSKLTGMTAAMKRLRREQTHTNPSSHNTSMDTGNSSLYCKGFTPSRVDGANLLVSKHLDSVEEKENQDPALHDNSMLQSHSREAFTTSYRSAANRSKDLIASMSNMPSITKEYYENLEQKYFKMAKSSGLGKSMMNSSQSEANLFKDRSTSSYALKPPRDDLSSMSRGPGDNSRLTATQKTIDILKNDSSINQKSQNQAKSRQSSKSHNNSKQLAINN